MKESFINPQEKQAKNILLEIKDIISKEDGLKDENREKITSLINQVDFVLGKYNQIYEDLVDVFSAMGEHDFTKKLPAQYQEVHDFMDFITLGLNMVNEQLKESVMHKFLVKRIFDAMNLDGIIVLVADLKGTIFFVKNCCKGLDNFSQEALENVGIHTIFEDYKSIEDRIKDEGSLKNMDSTIKWNGYAIPVSLTVAFSTQAGRMDGVIYALKFPHPLVMIKKEEN